MTTNNDQDPSIDFDALIAEIDRNIRRWEKFRAHAVSDNYVRFGGRIEGLKIARGVVEHAAPTGALTEETS